MEIFTVDQLLQLVISAAITSILSSAVSTIATSLEGKKLVVVVAVMALVVTVLRTSFMPGMKLADIQGLILGILLTWAFAVLFWTFVGKRFVDKLFTFVWGRIIDKLGGDTPTSGGGPDAKQ
jgi:hypothetical protein